MAWLPKTSPRLIPTETRDLKGEIYGVRYEMIPILLLNEFLKEHKKVEEQQSKIENQQAAIAELKNELR